MLEFDFSAAQLMVTVSMFKFSVPAFCAAAMAAMLVPVSALAKQTPPPAVNESGSPVFDKLRHEAIAKKVPLVIYLTGSSWCAYCNIFTNTHIKERVFKRDSGKKFIFWLVDTRQAPGRSPGSFTFQFVPEEAARVVGCAGSRAPYVVFGPPAVIILDPVSGKVIKSMVSQGDLDKEGKSLPAAIQECWKKFQEEGKKTV